MATFVAKFEVSLKLRASSVEDVHERVWKCKRLISALAEEKFGELGVEAIRQRRTREVIEGSETWEAERGMRFVIEGPGDREVCE